MKSKKSIQNTPKKAEKSDNKNSGGKFQLKNKEENNRFSKTAKFTNKKANFENNNTNSPTSTSPNLSKKEGTKKLKKRSVSKPASNLQISKNEINFNLNSNERENYENTELSKLYSLRNEINSLIDNCISSSNGFEGGKLQLEEQIKEYSKTVTDWKEKESNKNFPKENNSNKEEKNENIVRRKYISKTIKDDKINDINEDKIKDINNEKIISSHQPEEKPKEKEEKLKEEINLIELKDLVINTAENTNKMLKTMNFEDFKDSAQNREEFEDKKFKTFTNISDFNNNASEIKQNQHSFCLHR